MLENSYKAGIDMADVLVSVVGIALIMVGFVSIFLAIPRKSLHPEVAILQLKYFFYASIFLMVSGLILTILGLYWK
jgi:hypothetical protein